VSGRRRALILSALLWAHAACEGSAVRCDPSLSWSTRLPAPDAGLPCSSAAQCPVLDLALGAQHTCVRTTSAEVVCFGDNAFGQSAPGVTGDTVLPTRVPLPVVATTPVHTIAAGSGYSCSLGGLDVFCWGAPAVVGGAGIVGRTLSLDERPVSLRGGGVHLYVRMVVPLLDLVGVEEHLWELGAWNGRDPATAGDTTPHPSTLVASSVDSGGLRTCAIEGDGVHCWGGAPPDHRLAAGTWAAEQRIPGLSMRPVAAVPIAVGPLHACTPDPGRGIACWGRGERGQLGDGRRTSSGVAVLVGDGAGGALGAPVRLCVGGESTLGVDTDGTLLLHPQGGHACAITADGALWCWGANEHGQLGDGTRDDRALPVRVGGLGPLARSGLGGLGASGQLDCGGAHTCATDLDGALWCWGDNSRGQLGRPPRELPDSASPVAVDLFTR